MDFNNDGKIDLLAGDSEGNVWFYQNVGTTTEPKLAAGVKVQADGKPITGTSPQYEKGKDGAYQMVGQPNAVMGIYSKIHWADWDADGLADLLVGHESARSRDEQIVLYRNVGAAGEPKLSAPVPLKIIQGQPLSRPSPYVVDWDGDGKRDVLLGTDSKQVLFLRNVGSNQQPQFAAPEPISLPGMDECYRCRIAVVDWNNDGKLDLLVGTFYSGRSTDKAGRGNGGNVWLFLRK